MMSEYTPSGGEISAESALFWAILGVVILVAGFVDEDKKNY